MAEPILTLAGLAAFAIGVAQNATWDGVKYVYSRFQKSGRLDFERLLADAFLEAIDEHGLHYDEVAQTYLHGLRHWLSSNPEFLLSTLHELGYSEWQDFGRFLADIEHGDLQKQVAERLRNHYISYGYVMPCSLPVQVVQDALGYFRQAVLRCIRDDDLLRIILLETLGIEQIKEYLRILQTTVAQAGQMDSALDYLQAILIAVQQLSQTQQAVIEKQRRCIEKAIFLREVERLLIAKGFTIAARDLVPFGSDLLAIDDIGKRLVLSVESQAEPAKREQVWALYNAIEDAEVEQGWFIARGGFTPEASEAVARVRRPEALRLLTYTEFAASLVDPYPYLQGIVDEWKNSEVAELYLDMAARDVHGQEYRPLDTCLQSEIEDRRFTNTALLGDFGTGKSTFCCHFAATLAARYMSEPWKYRIPVLVELKEYEHIFDIQEVLVKTLRERGVQFNLDLSSALQRSGKLLFLFDGFDEMVTKVDRQAVLHNLQEIERIMGIGANAFMLTCRTHFFLDALDEHHLAQYRVIYLLEWGINELEAYLQRVFGENWQPVLEHITTTHNLGELAKTPLFLEMIVRTIGKIKRGVDINAAGLYELFTDEWIQRQIPRAVMTRQQKAQFMEELAWKMFLEGRSRIHWSELRELVQKWFALDVTEAEYFDNDVRTCSFLTRDKAGNYGFSHKSFMEFFIARKLFKEMRRGDTSSFYAEQPYREVYYFLNNMMTAEDVDSLCEWLEHGETVHLRWRAGTIGFWSKLPIEVIRGKLIPTVLRVSVRDPDELMRSGTIFALGEYGKLGIVDKEILRKHFLSVYHNDGNLFVRIHALVALKKIRYPVQEMAEKVRAEFSARGDSTQRLVKEYLTAPHDRYRWHLAVILGVLGSADHLEILKDLATMDNRLWVREAAKDSIEELKRRATA